MKNVKQTDTEKKKIVELRYNIGIGEENED